MQITADTVNEASKLLIDAILKHGDKTMTTTELQNCSIVIAHPSLMNIGFSYRHLSIDYANAELRWYWSGSNDCKEIGKHASMWLRLSDDGLTSNSAYGYIIQKKYGFNQLEQVIELLAKDKETRRAVLNISDPTINRIRTKDMQCTIGIQFLIRHDKLDMTVYMRSNDIRFGFPYDYIFFESIHEYIAERLNIAVGQYCHTATSIHLYNSDTAKIIQTDETVTIDAKSIISECYKI